ncbi:MAG: hypothetical protein JXA16_13785 [Bacteroidales bacterium]|nr:hypothetical protein [Bacteroidales bacterium]
MVTTGVNKDITFGGALSGLANINGSFATTLNVNPTGAIIFDGSAGTTTFNSFGTINLFSATSIPTATNLINFTRPTVTFSGISNLMMYPYNISFTTTAFNIIGPSNLFFIKTIDPSGTTIPDALNMNLSNSVNLEIEAEDLTVRGRILNSLGSGHIYLTSENDINIDATTIANSARVGTLNGDVKINCLNNLNVLAGSLANSFAQIGIQGTNINSDIYLNVQNDVNITGGSGAAAILNHYAAIGHGSKTPLQGTHQGNIIIELIGGDLNITGGGTPVIPTSESGARLGHGGLDLTTAAASIVFSGDIRGTAVGSRAVVNGDINITGGWGDQCFAQIGHGASTASGANSTIQLLGNILLQCNNLNMVTQNNLVAATFEMFAGIGHKIRFAASNLSSLIDGGGIDVKVLNDATMTAAGNGGAVFLGAYINNSGGNTSTGSIDLDYVNFDVNNNLLVQGSTTAAAQENKAIIGVYSDFVASFTRSSLNVNVGNEFNFISNTGDSCFLISGQTPTLNRQTNISVGGNFNFLGGQKTLSLKAIDTLDLTVNKNMNFQCNSALSTEFASIESENTMNINVGGDLRISGNAQTLPPSTDFGFAFVRNNSLTSGDMTIFIGKTLSMNPFSKLENKASAKELTIVSDNNFPNRWDSGSGGVDFSLNTYFLTNSGPIRVFTVDQSQNVISNVAVNYPSFNGNKFTPGVAYQDTAQEIWGEYYPSSLSGFPFTFFYKTSGPVDVLEFLEQKNNIFIPFFELFYRRFARFFDITNEYYDTHPEE